VNVTLYAATTDEPTTGLDSVTALALTKTLHTIAENCTVICTIHQPQSKIFALFDDLILLAAGDIAYQGPAKDAVTYFEKTGSPCPPLTNPADHILVVSVASQYVWIATLTLYDDRVLALPALTRFAVEQ
jgi:ATP-binding cassette, subfamily G (WHITE), member 2